MSENARYAGSCTCGNVTLKIVGEAVQTRQCGCRQCPQTAAGGPTHNAIVRADDVIIQGGLASNGYTAAGGNTLTSYFCPNCGTPVYCQSSAFMWRKTVRFGVVHQPHGLRPQMAIWTDDAPDWAVIDSALEQFPQQPPAPVKTS